MPQDVDNPPRIPLREALSPSRFRAWLLDQPITATYNMISPTECAIARYLTSVYPTERRYLLPITITNAHARVGEEMIDLPTDLARVSSVCQRWMKITGNSDAIIRRVFTRQEVLALLDDTYVFPDPADIPIA